MALNKDRDQDTPPAGESYTHHPFESDAKAEQDAVQSLQRANGRKPLEHKITSFKIALRNTRARIRAYEAGQPQFPPASTLLIEEDRLTCLNLWNSHLRAVERLALDEEDSETPRLVRGPGAVTPAHDGDKDDGRGEYKRQLLSVEQEKEEEASARRTLESANASEMPISGDELEDLTSESESEPDSVPYGFDSPPDHGQQGDSPTQEEFEFDLNIVFPDWSRVFKL